MRRSSIGSLGRLPSAGKVYYSMSAEDSRLVFTFNVMHIGKDLAIYLRMT
jgi:hypothetical protein